MIAKKARNTKPARKSRWLRLRVDETFEAQLAALQKAEPGAVLSKGATLRLLVARAYDALQKKTDR